MARITVEDCLMHVNNRFDLVLVAAKRARQLSLTGAEPLVPWENDKPTVVALREIAAGYLKNGEIVDPKKIAESEDESEAASAASLTDEENATELTEVVNTEQKSDDQPEGH